MRKFNHVISLGYFCSVAMELERKGLRTASYPFDWVLSDNFEKVIKMIETNFEGFLDYDNLYQEEILDHYYNSNVQIHCYHDFNSVDSLEKQIVDVSEKYKRRIERFYKSISEPTLFVRYCRDKTEEKFIRENEKKIGKILKSYNPHNSLLYIVPSSENRFEMNLFFGGCYINSSNGLVRAWIDAVPGLKEYLFKNIMLNKKKRIYNLLVHYRSRVQKRIKTYFAYRTKNTMEYHHFKHIAK